jgi:hypothetical protein
MFDQLREAGRVVLHPCGHAEVPKLGEHQHLAGVQKQVRSAFNEHLRACVSPSPAETRGNPHVPEVPRLGKGNGNGRERVTVGEGKERVDALAQRDEEDAFEAARRLRSVS